MDASAWIEIVFSAKAKLCTQPHLGTGLQMLRVGWFVYLGCHYNHNLTQHNLTQHNLVERDVTAQSPGL